MDVKNKSKNKDVFIVDFSKTVSISAPAIFSGVDRSDQIRQVHINSHAYTCIHQRIQLAVGDMTMSGWKPTISLINPPPPHALFFRHEMMGIYRWEWISYTEHKAMIQWTYHKEVIKGLYIKHNPTIHPAMTFIISLRLFHVGADLICGDTLFQTCVPQYLKDDRNDQNRQDKKFCTTRTFPFYQSLFLILMSAFICLDAFVQITSTWLSKRSPSPGSLPNSLHVPSRFIQKASKIQYIRKMIGLPHGI